MNAELVKATASGATKPHRHGRFPWQAMAIGSFAGSGVCLITGLLASLASLLGILPVSPVTARGTVAILLASFILAFLGAHSIDKLADARRDDDPRH